MKAGYGFVLMTTKQPSHGLGLAYFSRNSAQQSSLNKSKAHFGQYMYIRVGSQMGDSGAVFTTETTRNSVLKNATFKIFALKMVELTCNKGLANNCQNKTSL